MGALLDLAGTAGFQLITFVVLFIVISLAVIWILDRMASLNRSLRIDRFYATLPPCRDKLGRVQLGQLADNIDRLADHLKDRRTAKSGSSDRPDDVEYRLADDLAELARCARTMQAFMDRNAPALMKSLPLMIGRSVRRHRLLSAPPVQPESAPPEYRGHELRGIGAQKATASEPRW